MTLQEYIEEVQKHAPEKGHTEITKMVNRALYIFCEDTRIIEKTDTITSLASILRYNLASDVSIIRKVTFDGKEIAMATAPNIGDIGLGSDKYYYFIDGDEIGIFKDGSTIGYNDAGYDIVVTYYGNDTALSALGSTPSFPEKFHEAILNYVLWHIYQEPMHADLNMANWFYKGYELLARKAKKYALKRKRQVTFVIPYEY